MNKETIKSILNKSDLDLREKIALIAITCYLEDGLCSLKRYELKKLTGLNSNNIRSSTRNLIDKGYITKINNTDQQYSKYNFKKHQNVYYVNKNRI